MVSLGRYRVLRCIGSGGMAEVLEAVSIGDAGFERRVAIKRMLASTETNPAMARMFLDEARIASRLHHGNVVSVLDYGVIDGRPFQVMEFVDGLDAHKLLRLGAQEQIRLPIEHALYICTEIGHGLGHAHRAVDGNGQSLGIVHRDVKPANILIAWTGDIKLTDFGIAFALDRAETTVAGTVKGTPSYMAPEQVLHAQLDPRTDIFALGCVLHALVAGRSPLQGEDRLSDLLAGSELPLDDDLPDDVRAIVARAVRRTRGERFASTEEMTTVMGEALSQRIDRDAKTLFREWLTVVRPVLPSVRAEPAEDLSLEIHLVMDDGEQRVFATRSEAGVLGASPPTVDERATNPTLSRAPRRARRVVAALAGVSLSAGLLAGIWFGRSPSPSPSPSPVVAVAKAEPPAPVAPSESPPPEPPPPAVGKIDEPPRAADPIAETHRHHSRPASPATGGRPPASAPAAPSAPVSGIGVLAVGGELALNAQILIDGKTLGFAPKLIELPLGRHQVELLTPDGRHIGPATIELNERNTRRAPLRFPSVAARP